MSLIRRMTGRDRHEAHRVATNLELFFDLCFVVAVAQAGSRLAHALTEHQTGHALVGCVAVFFAIWWAWMNFTWFASAYDTDDIPYRIAVLLQIAGALVLAAGVARAFDRQDFAVVAAGYAIMRAPLILQWLRAAATDPERRATDLRYAVGLALVQSLWIVWLFFPQQVRGPLFPVIALLDVAVPVIAESAGTTPWHPHHIAERYGLFTLIVLGESVAAATAAVQSVLDEHLAFGTLLPLAAGGLLICFCAWWVYFSVDIHRFLTTSRQAFFWGYGHYLVFMSAAAIGAGLEVGVEEAVGAAHIPAEYAAAAVTVPTAVFLLTTWLLHARHVKRGVQQPVLPIAAVLVLLCTFAGREGVLDAGIVCAATVAIGETLQARRLSVGSGSVPNSSR